MQTSGAMRRENRERHHIQLVVIPRRRATQYTGDRSD